MWYSFFAYIKFLIKSTNKHGVHSPFVYNVVTKCLQDKKQYFDYKKLMKYKKELLNNDHKIKITDLGSGSKTTKRNTRKVSHIARTSGTSLKRAKLLYRIAQYFQSQKILELGTSLGIATQAISTANPEALITTIEGCPNISNYTENNFKTLDIQNVTFINSDFDSAIHNLKDQSYDLIFFDGNHQKEATLNYFNWLVASAQNDSIFIVDDIYWSKDMTDAWEAIKQHPKVTVTVDTFYWGIVFFRKEQAKEHFSIRI